MFGLDIARLSSGWVANAHAEPAGATHTIRVLSGEAVTGYLLRTAGSEWSVGVFVLGGNR